MSNEQHVTCRISDNEIDYLDNYWDGKFSTYVHNSIKRDIKQITTNKNRKQLDLFKDISAYVVLIALGTIFFLFGIQNNNSTIIIVYYIIGLFLVVMGIAGGMIIALQTTRKHNR